MRKGKELMDIIISGGLYRLLTEHFGISGVPMLLWMIPPILVCAVCGYLLGSINSAVIISRSVFGDDVRRHGSGNAGMTNMFRTFGKKGGLLTLAGDMGKTVIAVLVGYLCMGYMGAYLAGMFCIIGHMFPVFYKFRGGKGVLAAATMILLTEPLAFVVLVAIFAIVLLGTRMVSMASAMAALLYPMVLSAVYAMMTGNANVAGMRMPIAVFITAMILFMHRENFKRIYAGTERKINFPWNHDDGGRGTDSEAKRLSDADDIERDANGDKDEQDTSAAVTAATKGASGEHRRRVSKHSNYGKKKK